MDLRSGSPYFLLKNNQGRHHRKLTGNLNTEVLIIGSGISGALMAFCLLQRGIKAVIVDRRNDGWGSTAASTGMLLYELDTPLSQLEKMIRKELAEFVYKSGCRAIEDLGKIRQTINAGGFTDCRSVFFAGRPEDNDLLRTEYAVRKSAGLKVSFEEAGGLNEHYGLSSSSAIVSEEAAKMDTVSFTLALHEYNRMKGVVMYGETPVNSIEHRKDHIEVRTDDGMCICADRLICATGYETVKDVKLPVKLQSTYVFAGKRIKGLPEIFRNTVFWNSSDPYLYIREDNGRMIVGGRDEPFYDPEKRDSLLNRKTIQLKDDFEIYFPGMKTEPEYAWTGTFARTPDSLPLIGEKEGLPGIYFALGFGGNGITFGMLAGELITGIISGTGNCIPECFDINRKII
jgi:glycine/D-amino acid oxidase-like deaminating enzyme